MSEGARRIFGLGFRSLSVCEVVFFVTVFFGGYRDVGLGESYGF